jgi:hypothetical protein
MTSTAPDPYVVSDRYFTDGVSLYRLVGWIIRPSEAPLAELEDCRSLDTVMLERDDLLALRPVAWVDDLVAYSTAAESSTGHAPDLARD